MGMFESLGRNAEQVRVQLPDPAQPGSTKPVVGRIKTRAANVLERAFSTAWQAFFGALALTPITSLDTGKKALMVALGTIVPTLLSVAKNLFTSRGEG